MTKIIKHVKYHANKTLNIGNIDVEQDFLHIDDVIDGIMTMFNSYNYATDYIISSGISHHLKDVIKYIYETRDIHINWTKSSDHYIGTDADTGQILVDCDMNLYKCKNPVQGIVYDNSKLLSLGLKPKYDLKQIIHEMFELI